MRPLPRIDRLSWKLGLSIAVLVMAGLTAGFLLVYRYYHAHLLTVTHRAAATETRLVRLALEYQMLQKDRQLIRQMVGSLARDRNMVRVMILDREGRVQVSSDPAIKRTHFEISSPTCTICHRLSPEQRSRSTLLPVEGGAVLRGVEPIPNRKACHGCHDPLHGINGLIIVDLAVGKDLGALEKMVGRLALWTGGIGLLLVFGLSLVLRRLVLRRLFRFEVTARAIAQGDMERRLPATGNDALTRVERQFNTMADAVGELLTRLRAQRHSLEKVMNSVDDGMVVLDRSRKVVAVNDAFLRRFPAHGKEVMGLSCRVLAGCSEGEDGDGPCVTQACFASGKVQMTLRMRALPDGGSRQEEVVASPVHGDDGAITHVVETWRDITDRRSAEARLAEYQRMVSLGMLASGFSHEVNTPLASIGTCLDGIKRLGGAEEAVAGEDKEELMELALIAADQVQRCGAITQQFLKLARGQSLAREVLNLGELAQATVRLCQPTAREAGVSVSLERGAPPPTVLANSSAVQQVLLNLILNAVQASGQGQRVTVACATGAGPMVQVRDQGAGIPAEDLGRIFEPFFTRRRAGTGLGLFVSMNLARWWGGDILAESAPGQGSVFTLVFPPPGDLDGGEGA